MPHTTVCIQSRLPVGLETGKLVKVRFIKHVPPSEIVECHLCQQQVELPVYCSYVGHDGMLDRESEVVFVRTNQNDRYCVCGKFVGHVNCLRQYLNYQQTTAAKGDHLLCSLCRGIIESINWSYNWSHNFAGNCPTAEDTCRSLMTSNYSVPRMRNEKDLTISHRYYMAGVMDKIDALSQEIGFANDRVNLKEFLSHVADKKPVVETNKWILQAELSEGHTGNATTELISLPNEWLEDKWPQGRCELVENPGYWVSIPEREHRKMLQGETSLPNFYDGFRKFELYHEESEFYDNFSAAIYRVSSSLNPQQTTIDNHQLRTLSFLIHQGGFNDKILMRSRKNPLQTRMQYIKTLFNEHVTSSVLDLSNTASLVTPDGNEFLPIFHNYRLYLIAIMYPPKPGNSHPEHFLTFAVADGLIFDCRYTSSLPFTKASLLTLINSNIPSPPATNTPTGLNWSTVILYGLEKPTPREPVKKLPRKYFRAVMTTSTDPRHYYNV